MVREWIANAMWDALKLFAGRVHDWAFNPQRHAKIRFRNRERWWRYVLKAEKTKDPRDDMRAKAWQIEFGFETPPTAAIDRGDLDKHR